MNYKTIIFDFDGTIANTLPFTFKKIAEIASKLDIKTVNHRDILIEIRSKSYQELMKEFKLSWVKLPFIFSAFRKMQEELYRHLDEIKLFPGMRSSLLALKKSGLKLGILSLNLKKNIDRFFDMEKLTVFDFIEHERNIFGKDKVLARILNRYRLSKDEVIYIGDEVRDVEACKKAGIKIIAVTWGFHMKKYLLKSNPEYLIDQPEEMVKILQL